jgi:hypothetical protein
MPALSARPFHVMSANLRVADRAHRKSSRVLAELLHLWEVVNVVDENLGPGEGGLRRPRVVDGKETWPGLMAVASPLSVELPGIELGTKTGVTCRNADSGCAKQRETTRNDLRRRERC